MNQHTPEQPPQLNPKPWSSRLLSTQRSDDHSRRQEGRARHRSETTNQGNNGSRTDGPSTQPEKSPPHDQPTRALPAAHWNWGQTLSQAVKEARDNLQPDGPAAGEHPQQLQREHARVLRLLADAAHQSAAGFQDGLRAAKPSPPHSEPQATIYLKAYESGREAARALNRRARRRQRRSDHSNSNPDPTSKEPHD